jgi:predicted transcriptional regulator
MSLGKNTFIAVRVPPEVIESLDQVAERSGQSRSRVIRDLMENCHSLHRFLEAERKRQQTERIALDGNITDWVLNNIPQGVTPDLLHFLGQVMHHAADRVSRAEEKEG